MNHTVDASLMETIIKQVNAVSPWTPEEAAQRSASARREVNQHGHSHSYRSPEEEEMTRSNCAACILNGYGADKTKSDEVPNHVLWLVYYIECRKVIPSAWLRTGLLDAEDNKPFYDGLLRDVRTFGLVTYLDGAKVTLTF